MPFIKNPGLTWLLAAQHSCGLDMYNQQTALHICRGCRAAAEQEGFVSCSAGTVVLHPRVSALKHNIVFAVVLQVSFFVL